MYVYVYIYVHCMYVCMYVGIYNVSLRVYTYIHCMYLCMYVYFQCRGTCIIISTHGLHLNGTMASSTEMLALG